MFVSHGSRLCNVTNRTCPKSLMCSSSKVESEPTDSHVAKRFPTDATTHFGMNEEHLEVFDTNTYMGLDTNITRSQPGHIQVTTRSQPGHIQVMRIPNQNWFRALLKEHELIEIKWYFSRMCRFIIIRMTWMWPGCDLDVTWMWPGCDLVVPCYDCSNEHLPRGVLLEFMYRTQRCLPK